MSGNSGQLPHGAGNMGMNNNAMTGVGNQHQIMQQQLQAMQAQMQQQLAIMRRQQAQIQNQRAQLAQQQGSELDGSDPTASGTGSSQAPGGGVLGNMSGMLAQQMQQPHHQNSMSAMSGLGGMPGGQFSSGASGSANSTGLSNDMSQAAGNQSMGGSQSGMLAGMDSSSSKNAMLLQQLQFQKLQQMQQHQQSQQRNGVPNGLAGMGAGSGGPSGMNLSMLQNQQSMGGPQGMQQLMNNQGPSGGMNPLAAMQNMQNTMSQRGSSVGGMSQMGMNGPQGQGLGSAGNLLNQDSPSMLGLQGQNQGLGSGIGGMMNQLNQRHSSATGSDGDSSIPGAGTFPGAMGNQSSLAANNPLLQLQQQQQQFLAMQQQMQQAQQGSRRSLLDNSQSPGLNSNQSGNMGQGMGSSLGGAGLSMLSNKGAGNMSGMDMPRNSFSAGNMAGGSAPGSANPNGSNPMMAMLQQSHGLNGSNDSLGQNQFLQNPMANSPVGGPSSMFPPTSTVSMTGGLHDGSKPGTPSLSNPTPNNAASSDEVSVADFSSAIPSALPDFAGGWQSNADLPDRRRVIVNIVKIIERMRPDANKMAIRLPLMAKKLEEHLYRSAATKAEYIDSSTLKRRLQLIAHRLGLARSSGSGRDDDSVNSGFGAPVPVGSDKSIRKMASGLDANSLNESQNRIQDPIIGIGSPTGCSGYSGQAAAMMKMNTLQRELAQQGMLLNHAQTSTRGVNLNQNQRETLMRQLDNQQQQLQGLLSQAGGNGNDLIEMSRLVAKQKAQLHAIQNRNGSDGQNQGGMANINQGNSNQGPNGLSMMGDSSSSTNIPQLPGMPNMMNTHSRSSSEPRSQREKVVRQQQQRLLLLRHASKCSAGPSCKTQFCAEMVKLWQHMKQCRDKNCQTAHCLSSRCVLHHYRICKGEGRTGSCEVCAPVMKQIKWQSMSSGETDGVDLMEQLAKEQAEQDHGDDNASTASTNSLRGSLANQSKGAGGNSLQMQMQALLQQQQQGIGLGGDGNIKGNAMANQLQNQHGGNPQAMNRNLQALQQQANQNFPLSDQQQRQQAALLQQLQEQQQTFLMQLQRKAGGPGDTTNEQNSSDNQGSGMPSLSNTVHSPSPVSFPEPFEQTSGQGDDEEKSKGKQRRVSQTGRKRKSEVGQAGKAMKRVGAAGGKGKRIARPKKQDGESADLSGHSISPEPMNMAEAAAAAANEDDGDSEDETSGDIKKENKSMSKATGDDQKGSESKESNSAKKNHTNLVDSMKTEEIQKHIESLSDINNLSPRRIAQKCIPIINKLINDPNGWVFKDPVDPVELGIPDYFDVIKHPMDLSLVKKRLENGLYKHLSTFESDAKLVFQNCILYNGEDSDVGEMAKGLLRLFEKEYQAVVKGFKPDTRNVKGDICSLCDGSRKQFEPTILYCNGACGMQRIRRNTFYYTDICKQNHWCPPCYDKLKEGDPILLDDGNEIKKKELQKLKNDALAEEGWVECDKCNTWIHQICALFNGRRNKSSSSYTCPKCIIKERSAIPDTVVIAERIQTAADLPHNALSRYLENGLNAALEKAYAQTASERRLPPENVERAECLSVRVVSNLEKKHQVRDEMYKRYQSKGFPSEFPVRTKCILLFQSIHGVDVLLFGMYVYEFDHECPAPNKRRVYISYLDSVQFFQPREYRTLSYHTIIIEYLRHVKERGFHTAHIWSCPPSKGDDYIFHVHPNSQKTPRDDMLCNWYKAMLDRAQDEGVVLQTRSLFDEYFKPDSYRLFSAQDPTCLPYFEGDYIPGELENIIKDVIKNEECLRNDKAKISSIVSKRNDSKDNKPTGKKKGTRSNPGDLVGVEPDKVMLRLGQALSNMKQNFFVVHLLSREFAEAVDKGEDVSNWTMEKEAKLAEQILKKNGNNTLANKKSKNQIVLIGNTTDPDPPIESELFDSRQQFLNYCQSNHFQFDEMRRAKHTTMMVLYHIHDPAAPKFLSQCGACYREINHGVRYHCKTCSNFDLCQECYKPVTTGLWAQRDKRFAHDKSHKFSPVDMDASAETQKERLERQKSIKLHLELLEHCATCAGRPECTSSNCNRMRGLFTHLRTCKLTYRKGCKVCSRFIALLSMHAKQCSVRHSERCKIPYCDPIRERNYRLRQQQQLMDDRRRAAQNELYRSDRNANV